MRINIIPVTELTDQHLQAEYLEIQLLCDSLRRTLASRHGFIASKVPARFTLNKGHVYFFFNKGRYLHRRYNEIVVESLARGVNVKIPFPKFWWPLRLYKEWEPEPGDFIPIRKRIAERIDRKPQWYRFWKKPLTRQHLLALGCKLTS